MIRGALIRSHPRRIVIFVGIGVINTAIDVFAFASLYGLVGLDVISSNVVAFLIAVTNSYAMNRLITFADRRGRRDTPSGLARFIMVALAAMSVSTAIVYLISMFAHPMIGKLIATVASTTINYTGCYWFAFPGGSNARRRPLMPWKWCPWT
jgi:putative flippase GtrA